MVFIIYCRVCQVYLVWCLLKRYGVEPPGLIKLEKEIEQEETLSAPSPSPSPSSKSSGKKSTGNLLDDAVSSIHQVSYQYLLLFELQNSFYSVSCLTSTYSNVTEISFRVYEKVHSPAIHFKIQN